MKQKTAIKQLIEKLNSRLSIEGDGSEYFEALRDVIKLSESLEPVNEQQIKDADHDRIIDFAKWYSGMDIEKVKRAYERYLREHETFEKP
jgi:hypothetical protein